MVRFAEIPGWKQNRELAPAVSQTTAAAFAKNPILCDPMQRAAVSILANIDEGWSRGGRKEFGTFLGHSHGSCAERKSRLDVALDAGMLARQPFDRHYRLARTHIQERWQP